MYGEDEFPVNIYESKLVYDGLVHTVVNFSFL